MTVTVYPNGIGGSLGSSLATCKPFLTSGNVWYVNSVTGTDAASPAGQNREKPLLTIAQALTNSAAGDTVVLMDGSVFALTSTVDLAGRFVVGEGSSGGIPTVQIGTNALGALSMGTAGGELRNVRFTASAAARSGLGKLLLTASYQFVEDCYFDLGQYDDGPAISLATALTNHYLRGCTFVSTATSVAAQPLCAVFGVGTASNFTIEDCVFDAGTAGFSSYWALDLNAGAITRVKGTGLSFLRGADYRINSSSTGYFNPQTTTGGSRGSW